MIAALRPKNGATITNYFDTFDGIPPHAGYGGPAPHSPSVTPDIQSSAAALDDDDCRWLTPRGTRSHLGSAGNAPSRVSLLPPPADIPRAFPGYEHLTSADHAGEQIPPPDMGASNPDDAIQFEFHDPGMLNEDECRRAVINSYTQDSCCQSQPVRAQHVRVCEIKPCSKYRYSLESYCEGRIVQYRYEPHQEEAPNTTASSSPISPPPLPWDVVCPPDASFRNHIKSMEIPRTEFVSDCFTCHADGYIHCPRCLGSGHVSCHRCNEHPVKPPPSPVSQIHRDVCWLCAGQGQFKCDSCGGKGRMKCTTCDGHRKLRGSLILTSTFKVYIDEFLVDTGTVPDRVLSHVVADSVLAFEQVTSRVRPLKTHPVAEINEMSKKFIDRHKRDFPEMRILMQRQQLRALPVTEVYCTWRDTRRSFWIYGADHHVYIPDTAQSGCSCSIV